MPALDALTEIIWLGRSALHSISRNLQWIPEQRRANAEAFRRERLLVRRASWLVRAEHRRLASKRFSPLQPFRERPAADSYLRAPEHRTEESDLARRFLSGYPRASRSTVTAPLVGPEQSPLRWKVLHLDHIGWTQIVAAVAHSGTRILPGSLFCVPLRNPNGSTYIRSGQNLWMPSRSRRGFHRCRGKLVQHDGALSAQPADSHRN